MKKILLILLIITSITSTAQDSLFTLNDTTRLAIPNLNKDTLYVLEDMYCLYFELWADPKFNGVRPKIIPVDTLVAYIRRK